jgi:serine/threonine-protein kinase
MGGAVRDPMVGRDLLIGAAAGVTMTALSYTFHLVPGWLHWPGFEPHTPSFVTLGGARYVVATALFEVSNAVQNAMLGVMGLALLRLAVRREWLAFWVAVAIFTPLAARGQFQSGTLWLDLTFGAFVVTIILGVLFRYGLFAGIVGFTCHFVTFNQMLTLNPERQYFSTGLLAMGCVALLSVAGLVFTRPRDGRSMFSARSPG